MKDWQGMIGSYIVLIAVASDERIAPLAVAIAWAVAIGLAFSLAKNKVSLFSLFGNKSGG